MAESKYVKPGRTRVTRNTRTEVMDHQPTRTEQEREALKAELDELMEDIDDVLEENAEEFVKGFIQKGGE